MARQDFTTAFESLRRAWRLWQDLTTPYEAAKTRAVLGLACRAAGDDEAAAMEFDAARLAFSRLGAGPDLASMEHACLPRTTEAPSGLSQREIEVLCLVAVGHTNREIAATLIVSEHTVARHVQNIFAALGVSSRTAASAFAFEHDLV
ncbi:MAG: response regulator transcription factor [Gaiellaceae bacterium]